jgi:decaprenylphospho-beta-D-erythro-pentofuranosid-2-ulose 2-reductase
VVIVKLGPVHTPMTVDHPKNPLFADSPSVARSIVAAIDGRRGEVFVPWYWRPIMGVVTTLPEAIFQRLGFLSGR